MSNSDHRGLPTSLFHVWCRCSVSWSGGLRGGSREQGNSFHLSFCHLWMDKNDSRCSIVGCKNNRNELNRQPRSLSSSAIQSVVILRPNRCLKSSRWKKKLWLVLLWIQIASGCQKIEKKLMYFRIPSLHSTAQLARLRVYRLPGACRSPKMDSLCTTAIYWAFKSACPLTTCSRVVCTLTGCEVGDSLTCFDPSICPLDFRLELWTSMIAEWRRDMYWPD